MRFLDNIYTDEMVLPADKPLRIAGQTPKPFQEVTLEFLGQKQTMLADKECLFEFWLPARPMTFEPETLVLKVADKHQVIKNIRFGKVYLFSGQSNIEFKLKDECHYSQEKENFALDGLYYYNVFPKKFTEPTTGEVCTPPKENTWKKVTQAELRNLSALAFYTVSQVAKVYGGPIGIVQCFKGGTSIANWLSKETLANDLELRTRFLEPFEQRVAKKTASELASAITKYQVELREHTKQMKAYQRKYPTKTLNEVKEAVGHTPWPPPKHPDSYLRPGGINELMVQQLRFAAFTEVIWYQGENDVDNVPVYEKLLYTLLMTWRKFFKDSSLKFTLIQLPGYADGKFEQWAQIRQVQYELAKRTFGVELVSIVDTGEKHNIHPVNKKIAGQRLGRCLSKVSYQSTPYVSAVKRKNDQIVLTVANAEQLKVTSFIELEAFSLTGECHKLTLAQVMILKDQIIIKDNGYTKLRYAYKNWPHLFLVNEWGDPISPFEVGIK